MASGFDLVPCHGDGNVSNVLLADDGRMMLVDWDVAAVMDPLQDIGVLLAEVRPFDRDRARGIRGGLGKLRPGAVRPGAGLRRRRLRPVGADRRLRRPRAARHPGILEAVRTGSSCVRGPAWPAPAFMIG